MRPTSRMREVIARPVCTIVPGIAETLAAGFVAREELQTVYAASRAASLTRPGMSGGRPVHAARIVEAKRQPFDGP